MVLNLKRKQVTMTDKEIIIDGKIIGCPCYIDRPLHRYHKGCLVQSQAFKEQQTEEKPILRCDEIKNCPIKENFKQLQFKTAECEKLNKEIINKNEKIKELRFSVSDLTNRLCLLNAEKSFRIVDLEQALDEIAAHYQKVIKNITNYDDSYDASISIKALHNISDIINKAKEKGMEIT